MVYDWSLVSQNIGPDQTEQMKPVCMHERAFCFLAIFIVLVLKWKTEIH